MGWDSASHWTTKQVVVDEIIREYGAKLVTHKVTASGVWSVIKVNHYKTGEEFNLIVLDLLEKHGGTYSRKSISEDMGPHYYDCPKSFLALAPCKAGSYAEAWRAKVLAGGRSGGHT